jgi:hypothetical protein
MLSKRANTTFLISSVVTFVSFAAVVAVTVFDLTIGLPSLSFGHSTMAVFGFGLCFLIAAVCIVAQITLWLGMIWFTLVDTQPLLFKVPVVLFQIVFLSIGSAIIYLTFYRSGSKHLTKLNVSDVSKF